jgi:hypothetical protein
MNVFILVTNRQPELNPGSVMVFDTLRKGFPTANINVTLNSGIQERENRQAFEGVSRAIDKLAKAGPTSIQIGPIQKTIHHDWIAGLIANETEPFFICDTDVVFWDNFEQFDFSEQFIAGRRIPQWRDEFTACVTRPRLHTSLLYIDPVAVRREVQTYFSKFPKTPFNPFTNLVDPLCVPFKSETYFYDTMSMMYHAIGGTRFNDWQLDCYDHMNFGTIEDVVLPHLKDGEAAKAFRDEVYKHPSKAKGMWRHQEKYYADRVA